MCGSFLSFPFSPTLALSFFLIHVFPRFAMAHFWDVVAVFCLWFIDYTDRFGFAALHIQFILFAHIVRAIISSTNICKTAIPVNTYVCVISAPLNGRFCFIFSTPCLPCHCTSRAQTNHIKLFLHSFASFVSINIAFYGVCWGLSSHRNLVFQSLPYFCASVQWCLAGLVLSIYKLKTMSSLPTSSAHFSIYFPRNKTNVRLAMPSDAKIWRRAKNIEIVNTN